jgi:xanthine/uracil permease
LPDAALDVLTVPLVAGSSAFALFAVIAVAEGLRRARLVPRAAIAAIILAGLLLVAGSADTILSGLDEPLPPVAVTPPALVLGIALLRRASRRTPASRELSLAATSREA